MGEMKMCSGPGQANDVSDKWQRRPASALLGEQRWDAAATLAQPY